MNPVDSSAPFWLVGGRYNASRHIEDFVARFQSGINHYVEARAKQLLPVDEHDMIGHVPNWVNGRPEEPGAFVTTHAVGGSNAVPRGPNFPPLPGLEPYRPSFNVDVGVLNVALPGMADLPTWGAARTRLRDRIDAVIAHEYTEANVVLPVHLERQLRATGMTREIGLFRHYSAVANSPNVLPDITPTARRILAEYRERERLAGNLRVVGVF